MGEDPLPAVVEVEGPGAESPAWATVKVSEAVSPATTRSDTTTEGVRGPLKIIADGLVGGNRIMSARLISAGPRPGYTPIFHDSLCPIFRLSIIHFTVFFFARFFSFRFICFDLL